MCAKSLQSCPTLCIPMDCSLAGSSIYGILQARILESVAISFSRGSFWPRDQNCISCDFCIAGRFFITEPPGKPLKPRLLVPHPQACWLLGSVVGLEYWILFLTRTQVTLMLLVWRPHVRSHCNNCSTQKAWKNEDEQMFPHMTVLWSCHG